MNIDAITLLEALEKAYSIASKRLMELKEGDPKVELWRDVYWALHSAVVNGLHRAWDGRTKPTRFVARALREKGLDKKVAELAATTLGEALEGCTREFELLVARGREIPEWYMEFEEISGLRSCMTEEEKSHALRLYAEHPDVVSLWILADRKGKAPLARALMWEKALIKVGDRFVEGRLLDRVYAVSEAAGERLLALAREAGAWTRAKQTYHLLDWKGEREEEGGPVVSPDGKEQSVVVRVYLSLRIEDDPERLSFPYMDTLKHLVYDGERNRFFLSSRMPRKGPYAELTSTLGGFVGVSDFEELWAKRSRDLHNGAEEYEGEIFWCPGCNDLLFEEDAVFVGGEAYCSSCFMETFAECEGCGRAVKRGEERRHANAPYCPSCFERLFAECEGCGRAVGRGEALWEGGRPYCTDCAAECASCGRVVPHAEATYLDGEEACVCPACYEEEVGVCARCGWAYLRERMRVRLAPMGEDMVCEGCACGDHAEEAA